MNFNIGKTEVYGLEFAVKASGNPMRTVLNREENTEKDYLRAVKLGTTRGGEDKDIIFLNMYLHNQLCIAY